MNPGQPNLSSIRGKGRSYLVTNFDIHWDALSILVNSTGTNSKDCSLRQLLLRLFGDKESRRRFLHKISRDCGSGSYNVGFDSGDEDSVEQRADCPDVSGGGQLQESASGGQVFRYHCGVWIGDEDALRGSDEEKLCRSNFKILRHRIFSKRTPNPRFRICVYSKL
jgi:hypothetical protein